MINLLPPETRQGYRYARRNQKLVPWLIALALAIVGLALISVYGAVSLNHQANNYNHQISSSQLALNKEHVSSVKTEVGSISGSLKLAVQVLGREVLFSKLLEQITTVVPSGVNLTGLNINQDDGAIDIVANASNYQAATQLLANLTDPANQIFAKADLVSVNCATPSASSPAVDPAHPCTVTIRALFGPNNQFLFINEGKK